MHVLKSEKERLTLGYGKKTISLGTYFHTGNDFVKAPSESDYIIAAQDGVVTYTKNSVQGVDLNAGFGNYVKIKHAKGYETIYGHMKKDSIVVKIGDKVKKGQVIGYMGNTGYVTGIHLHFEIRINGNSVDPSEYISDKKQIPKDELLIKTDENYLEYIVKKGDTLTYIANKYNLSVEELVIKNNIKDKNLIYIGQKILIPKTNNIYEVVSKIGLNVRNIGSLSGKILMAYKYKTKVKVFEIKNGWGRTKDGWVKMEYLSN